MNSNGCTSRSPLSELYSLAAHITQGILIEKLYLFIKTSKLCLLSMEDVISVTRQEFLVTLFLARENRMLKVFGLE